MAKRSTRFEPPNLPAAGAVVTALLRSPATPGEITIKLGRKTAGVAPQQLIADLGIGEGVIWSDRMRDGVAAAMMVAFARTWSIRSVSRRAMTRSMLITKLRQRGLATAASDRIADELVASGMIDEKRFAEGLAETTIARRAFGTRRVSLKLRAKGITTRTADEVVDRVAAESNYDQRAAALAIARRKLRSLTRKPDPQARQRALYSLLARRGFDSELCREVTRTVLGEGEELLD